MRKLTLLLVLTLGVILQSYAQVSFTVKVPRRVVQGQNFAVTYRLSNGQGSGLQVRDISGCRKLYGPSTSTRQSYSNTNGQVTVSSTVDYTYTYRADKAGTFTVPEASISVDGKIYTTNPTEFTVVDAPEPSTNSNSASQSQVSIDDLRSQSAGRPVTANDVIVRIILSKSKAYEQEAIDCTIKLYTKYDISTFRPTLQPSFDGFLIEEIPIQASLNQVERYNGQDYRTAVLKRCIIFPQKNGKLTINSGNYDLTVVQYEEIPMGFFVTRQPVERAVAIKSNSISVDVSPLPEPQPADFSGAVGRFSAECRLVGSSFRTGDPATLLYTVQGTGNIKYLPEPQPDFPADVEQYTPKTEYDTHVSGGNVTGSMAVEYTFVPQNVGDFHIGLKPFVYFNPEDGQYHTIALNSFDIKVAKGVNQTVTDVDRQDISARNTDIRHIRTGDLGLSHNHSLVAQSVWYWILYPVAILLFVAAILINIKRIRAARDITGRRMSRANKVAAARLSKAKALMTADNTDQFIEELLKALWGYLSDKLGIPVSRLSRDNIRAEIISRYGQPGESAADSVTSVLDDCEMARYAPGSDTRSVADNLISRAVVAINAIQRLTPVKK